MSGLTDAEILRRAEQLIGQHGWNQGSNQGDIGGLCAYGAIRAAIAGTVWNLSTWAQGEAERIAGVVEAGLPSDWRRKHLTRWNDYGSRTEAEVRAALLAAAERAEAGT